MPDARFLRAFALALLVLVVVGVGVRGLTRALGDGEPGLDAEWIWADGAAEAGRPMAFWALRDVWLDRVEPAWMSVVADESYALWINGRLVGSGRWRPGAEVDLYAVEPYLQSGMNRLAVQARSARGAGGLLATLRLGVGERGVGERALVGTDASWRIVRFEAPGLLGGVGTLGDFGGEPPRVWGAPPTGRWRPLPPRDASPRQRPETIGSREAQRVRHATRPGAWVDLRDLERLPELADQVVFDFGEQVVGHLEVGLPCGAGGESRAEIVDAILPMLLFFGPDPPDVRGERPDEVLVAVPGSCVWRDAVARRFRYVGFVGGAPHRWLAVERVDRSVGELAAGEERVSEEMTEHGVFGLPPARGWSAVEEDVWDRLAADRERAEAR